MSGYDCRCRKPVILRQECLPIVQDPVPVCINKPAAKAVIIVLRLRYRHKPFFLDGFQGIGILMPRGYTIVQQHAGLKPSARQGLHILGYAAAALQGSVNTGLISNIRPLSRNPVMPVRNDGVIIGHDSRPAAVVKLYLCSGRPDRMGFQAVTILFLIFAFHTAVRLVRS